MPPQSLSDDVHEDFVEEEESGEAEGQETQDTGQERQDLGTVEFKSEEWATLPIDWPVFDGEPEVDAKLKDLGFSPRDARDLYDAGVSGEQISKSKATTKESLLLEVE